MEPVYSKIQNLCFLLKKSEKRIQIHIDVYHVCIKFQRIMLSPVTYTKKTNVKTKNEFFNAYLESRL